MMGSDLVFPHNDVHVNVWIRGLEALVQYDHAEATILHLFSQPAHSPSGLQRRFAVTQHLLSLMTQVT